MAPPGLDRRFTHHLVLCVAWTVLCLPHLGTVSLWDIDEGNNAESSREQYLAGNWIVPTFNYELRTDKPALLYWLQIAAYRTFGVSEFSARLPSALAALLGMLAIYELGRITFGRHAGLLAGLMLGSTAGFCGAAHFANPDALLTACTLLGLFVFYRDYRLDQRGWFGFCAVFTGLGALAKGPVGVVLPFAVIVLFLAWEGQLRRLLDWRLLGGIGVFLLVAAPWYVWVGLETKGAWLRGFFLKHNLERFRGAMENHHGPIVYYPLVLLAGFAPWSVFFLPSGWYAWKMMRASERDVPNQAWDRSHVRFFLCWIAVYLVAFTAARTKLPNYVLPLYPAVAILVAATLDRYRRGLARLPAWMMPLSLATLALVGVLVVAGVLVGSGVVSLAALRGRSWPGLEQLLGLGLLPMLAAAAGWWFLRRQAIGAAVASITLFAVLFTAGLAAWGGLSVDRYKAARELARALPPGQLDRDVRLAAAGWFQPSLVFYCGREVKVIQGEREVREFLRGPLESYLFLPAASWESLRPLLPTTARPIARHYDLYRHCDVVIIANR